MFGYLVFVFFYPLVQDVLGWVRLGQVRLGQDMFGYLVFVLFYPLVQDVLGSVRLGQVRLGQVRLGYVWISGMCFILSPNIGCFVFNALCCKSHVTLGRGVFCTPWSPFLSSNLLFISYSVMFLYTGLCTSSCLSSPVSLSIALGFYAPWCVLYLVEIHFSFFFFDSNQSSVFHGIF